MKKIIWILLISNWGFSQTAIVDTNAITGMEVMGTGLSYSLDEGKNWMYLAQPVDEKIVYFNELDSNLCVVNNYDWNLDEQVCYSNLYTNINWGNNNVKSL